MKTKVFFIQLLPCINYPLSQQSIKFQFSLMGEEHCSHISLETPAHLRAYVHLYHRLTPAMLSRLLTLLPLSTLWQFIQFFFLLDSLPTARTLFGGTLSRPLTCSSVSTWLKEFIYLCPCPFPRLSSFQVASQSQDCPSEGLKFGPKVLVIGIQFSHKFSHGPHLAFVLFSRQPEGEQAARFPLL